MTDTEHLEQTIIINAQPPQEPQEEELITKPKPKRKPMSVEEKRTFQDRMQQGKAKRKSSTSNIVVPSIIEDKPIEAIKEEPKIIMKEEVKPSTDNNSEMMQLLKSMQQMMALQQAAAINRPATNATPSQVKDGNNAIDKIKRQRPKKIKAVEEEQTITLKPNDIYNKRINEVKQNYLMQKIYKDLFG